MRNVSFWRILIFCIFVLLLANIFSLAAYTFVGKNAYVSIEMDKLAPEAEYTGEIYKKYLNGEISEATFQDLVVAQAKNGETAIMVTNPVGMPLIANNQGEIMDASEFGVYFEADIQSVLHGDQVRNNNLILDNRESAISVGTPIVENNKLVGAVFIVKSLSDIQSAFRKLSDTLMMIILVVLPVFMAVVAFVSKKITKPLNDMSKVALEMSEGNFSARADETSTGEVGVLATALNTLCENLSSTIFQLQNEKRYLNLILTSFSEGVVAVDTAGNLTLYNPAILKMFGGVEVTSPTDLIPDKAIWSEFKDVIKHKEPRTIQYAMPNDRKLFISIVPIMTEDKECRGAVGLFRDITELERLEQTRRDYVANISHELRSPLTAVRGLLEPLSDGLVKDEETKQKYYSIMLHEVERLSRLITDMLQLSRLQSGKESMKIKATNFQELLEEVYENYKHEAEKRGINLVLDAEKIPYAMTDRDRIEQVLVILLDNAMRYTPKDGTITISAVADDFILCSVTDTGCGIEEKELPHLFERFYKVDKSRNEGGTGLGLSIAKQIIDQLGEQITVESVVGKGTSFHFTVKRYYSNAIALGPTSEKGAYSAEDVTIKVRSALSGAKGKKPEINIIKNPNPPTNRIRNPFRKK